MNTEDLTAKCWQGADWCEGCPPTCSRGKFFREYHAEDIKDNDDVVEVESKEIL